MKKLLFPLLVIGCTYSLVAQDLMKILDQESPSEKGLVYASFKGTRILNSHSVENRKRGTLEFLISHRFGSIDQGIDQLFGLDQSNIRFDFEYAPTDKLMLGIGRSSFEKTYDVFAKYKILQQSNADKEMPVSVSAMGSVAWKTIKDYLPEYKPTFSQQLAYTTQVLIARKFNSKLSLQLSPTYIHFNRVPENRDPHDMFALGAGGRYKISKRVTINAEYFANFNPLESVNTKNVLALGVDIETGGHVFQLMLSNGITMIEKGFIAETTGDFFDGGIHFGFNISRAFQVGKRKE